MQHLFQVASLDEVPREQLEELVAEYPSFGVARYLLSRKLRAEGDGHFTEETLKTNLYFSNPYWLQWLLENNGDKVGVNVPRVAHEEHSPVIVEEVGVEEELKEEAFESGQVEGREFSGEALPTSADMATDESVAAQVSAADDIMASIAALRSQREHEEHVEIKEEEEPAPTHSLASMAMEQAEAGAIELEQPEVGVVITEAAAIETEINDNQHIEETKRVLEVEEAPVSEVKVPRVEEVEVAPQTEQVLEDVDKVGEALPTSADMATDVSVAPEPASPDLGASAHMAADQSAAPEMTGAAEPALSFQAFHTIDYFASQGIKLSLDENPSDKLGKQMKSFTDWLKTMRKLPQKNQLPVPDIAAEHLVRTSAAHSVEGKEVVTETMAEVLAKQGMREKATEVYRKLSLLNPDKSSYFANKIDQLKID